MKTIAYKRIQREIFKRSKIAYYEKSKRFIRFVSLSSESVANNLRLEYHAFRYQRFGRVGYCRNHCLISGRGHSVYRSFRLTRNMIRELAHSGQIYGLMKASWLTFLAKVRTNLKTFSSNMVKLYPIKGYLKNKLDSQKNSRSVGNQRNYSTKELVKKENTSPSSFVIKKRWTSITNKVNLMFSVANSTVVQSSGRFSEKGGANRITETMEKTSGLTNAIVPMARSNRYRVLKLKKTPSRSAIAKRPWIQKFRNDEERYRDREQLSTKKQIIIYKKRGYFPSAEENEVEKATFIKSQQALKDLQKKLKAFSCSRKNQSWYSRYYKRVTKQSTYLNHKVAKLPPLLRNKVYLEASSPFRINLSWIRRTTTSKNNFWWLQNRFNKLLQQDFSKFKKIITINSMLSDDSLAKAKPRKRTNSYCSPSVKKNNFFFFRYFKRFLRPFHPTTQIKVSGKKSFPISSDKQLFFFFNKQSSFSIKNWKEKRTTHFFNFKTQYARILIMLLQDFTTLTNFSENNKNSLPDDSISGKKTNFFTRNTRQYYFNLMFIFKLLKKVRKYKPDTLKFELKQVFYYARKPISKVFPLLTEKNWSEFTRTVFSQSIEKASEAPFTKWRQNLNGEHHQLIECILGFFCFFYKKEGQLEEEIKNKNAKVRAIYKLEKKKVPTSKITKFSPVFRGKEFINFMANQFTQAESFWKQVQMDAKQTNWKLEKSLTRRFRALWCIKRKKMRLNREKNPSVKKISFNSFKTYIFIKYSSYPFFKRSYKAQISKSKNRTQKSNYMHFTKRTFFAHKPVFRNKKMTFRLRKLLINCERSYQNVISTRSESFQGKYLCHFILNRLQKRIPLWKQNGARVEKKKAKKEKELIKIVEQIKQNEKIRKTPGEYWYQSGQIANFANKTWKKKVFIKTNKKKWLGSKSFWKKSKPYWCFSPFQKIFEWKRKIIIDGTTSPFADKTTNTLNFKTKFNRKNDTFRTITGKVYAKLIQSIKFNIKQNTYQMANIFCKKQRPSAFFFYSEALFNEKHQRYFFPKRKVNLVANVVKIKEKKCFFAPSIQNCKVSSPFLTKYINFIETKTEFSAKVSASISVLTTQERYAKPANRLKRKLIANENFKDEGNYAFQWGSTRSDLVTEQVFEPNFSQIKKIEFNLLKENEQQYVWVKKETHKSAVVENDLAGEAVSPVIFEEKEKTLDYVPSYSHTDNFTLSNIFNDEALEQSADSEKRNIRYFENRLIKQRLTFASVPSAVGFFFEIASILSTKKLDKLLKRSSIKNYPDVILLSRQNPFAGIFKNTVWNPGYQVDDIEAGEVGENFGPTSSSEGSDENTPQISDSSDDEQPFPVDSNWCRTILKPEINMYFGNYTNMSYRNEFNEYISQLTICLILSPRRNNSFIIIQPKEFKSEKGERIFQRSAGQRSRFKGFIRRSPQNRKELLKEAAFALLRYNKKDNHFKFFDVNLKNFFNTLNAKTAQKQYFQSYISRLIAPFLKKQLASRYPLININLLGASNKPRKPAYRSRKHTRAPKQLMY